MSAMRTAARTRPIETAKIGFLTTALLASTALVSVTTPASATCVATGAVSYDTCASAAAWATDSDVTLSGTAFHDGFIPANFSGPAGPGGSKLTLLTGANLTDNSVFGPGFWGTGVNLTINSGATLNLDGFDATGLAGFDTFASLNGAGTLNISGGRVIFGGSNANSAFSGTVLMPTLSNQLIKIGTGVHTINGSTIAEGELIDASTGGGGLAHSGGTSNIKAIAIGSGTGAASVSTMTGGILNIVGTGGVGVPCNTNCPQLRVGDFFGVGVFNQSGGTINVGAAGVAASLNIGNQSGNGTYAMSGGTLNLGVFGDVNSAGLYAVGRQQSASASHNGQTTTGVFNITGGTVNVNAGELINGDRDAGGAVGVTTNSTINLSGGTLRVRNGANLWLSAFDNGAAIDSTFNLSGTGILEIGDGRLQAGYLGGTGAYAFNLNGGQIRVIDSDLTTTVNANLLGASATTGTQINTNGLNANWNGILSGAGWLVKTGAGTLNLGGVNTYTGGTAMNGGTVFVDAFDDLGAATAGISFNGGTLQTGANFMLTGRTGTMNMAGNGTIDTQAFFEQFSGNLSGAGTLTKIGTGFLFLTGTAAAHTGAVNVNAGFLGADGGNAIGNQSAVTVAGGATFQISGGGPNVETIGSLAGSGSTVIAFGSTLITGANSLSTVYTGTISEGAGVGSLTKVGTGAFTVNNNLTYTGLTTVNGGTMILNGNMADSLLVAAGARFGGNANIAGSVTNLGTLSPGNSPGTINIAGNYAGPGIFDMEVQFNNAGAPVNGTTHDFVNIAGNASGATLINVIPFAPSNAPAATTGNGIELVRVGGTTGAGQFALAAPVFQGAFEYVLAYLPNYNAALDGYFLQSRLNETFFAEGAMFAASQAMMGACFRSEDGLTGDGNGHVGRAWAKVTHGGRETGADTGIVTDQDYTCGSGGIDLRTGGSWRFGVSGGYGDTSSDVTTAAGLGLLEGNGGMIQLHASMYHGPFFANIAAGYGQSNWDYTGPSATTADASLNGFVGSFQVGGLWPMGTGWRVGAIAELNYDGLDCDDDCLLPGTAADVTNLFMKGTVRIDGSMHGGVVLPFLALSVSDGDENTITNGSASFTTDTNAALFGAKAGATIMIGQQTALIVNGGVIEGLNNDVSGWDGTAGVKIFW